MKSIRGRKVKLRPQDIRTKEFSKKLFGYDPDEVEAFLIEVANAYQELLKEIESLRIKTPEYKTEKLIEKAKKEIEKIFFLVFLPKGNGKVVNHKGTPLDIGTTVLHFLGIDINIGLGKNLFKESGLIAQFEDFNKKLLADYVEELVSEYTEYQSGANKWNNVRTKSGNGFDNC